VLQHRSEIRGERKGGGKPVPPTARTKGEKKFQSDYPCQGRKGEEEGGSSKGRGDRFLVSLPLKGRKTALLGPDGGKGNTSSVSQSSGRRGEERIQSVVFSSFNLPVSAEEGEKGK